MASCIVVLGPPGSGKGTQCAILADELKYAHLSTGDLLRREVASATPLGQELKAILASGELVSDEVVLGLLRSGMEDSLAKGAGFILDGYPRSVGQAELLETLLGELGVELKVVVSLLVSSDVVTERILGRAASDSSARTDDNEETIRKRLTVFMEKTAPVSDYYRAKQLLSEIDGHQDVSSVAEEIRSHVR